MVTACVANLAVRSLESWVGLCSRRSVLEMCLYKRVTENQSTGKSKLCLTPMQGR